RLYSRHTAFYRSLKPSELHAHLLGSVSEQTVTKLMGRCRVGGQNMTLFEKGRSRTLDECFQAFKMIHKLTEDEESLNMVTRDVIKEFSQDGVKYLELRSTPREEGHTGIVVLKLIFCLEINYFLAQEYLLMSDECVVGVDLSGNPKIPGQEEETQALLQLQPHRIGHGTFLKTTRDDTSELVEHVRNLNIPLELCLTSNVNSQTVNTYAEHHFKFWFDQDHPCTFCVSARKV
uniref:Adenosine deaminase-like n=1 Tax=Eptatretus burgeri TaxID=7764 RepID=A0A8C4NIF9_EPTBU